MCINVRLSINYIYIYKLYIYINLGQTTFFVSRNKKSFLLLNFFIFKLTHPKGLPGADDPIMQRIHHVEHVALLETHLALLRLVVGEVGLDVEGVPPLVLHNLVVLLPPVLGCK